MKNCKEVLSVNHFGDHACPHCNVMVINPLDCELKAGEATCQVCGKKYKVSKKIAEQANENKAKFDKSLNRVNKELQKSA